MQFVIITGLSGAGKSEAMNSLEDIGYFCVDNLPPVLAPKFAEFCAQAEGGIQRVALVCDVRGGRFFDALADALDELERLGIPFRVLFLEAAEEVLVKRFQKTRRRHPLSDEGTVLENIRSEKRRLADIRSRAETIIDTTEMTPWELRTMIHRLFADNAAARLSVSIVSFGYKWGLPLDADLVFDLRFLPNPHYVDRLRPLTGLEEAVSDYVLKRPVTRRFLKHLKELLKFLLPQYVEEGKSHLLIALGCTGGRHRSVAIAEYLGRLVERLGFQARVEHRDARKEHDDAAFGPEIREGAP